MAARIGLVWAMWMAGVAWAADLTTAKEAARNVEPALVTVEARGWRARDVNPEAIVRVWDLPVGFTSSDALARAAGDAKLKESLEKPVTLDFADTPLQDALRFVQDFAAIAIDTAPGLELQPPRITLKVKDIPLRSALDYLLKQGSLDYRVRDNRLFVFAPRHPEGIVSAPIACDSAESGAVRRLADAMGRPVSVDFRDTPLRDMVTFLGETWFKGLNVVLDTRGLPKARQQVTFEARQQPLGQALDAFLRVSGLRLSILADVLVFSPAPSAGQATVMLTLDILQIQESHPECFSKAGGKIYAALERPVTLDFLDTPIADVITFLADFSALNMVLDRNALPERNAPATIKCRDLRLGDALALILRPHGLTYAVRNEALFMSNEDGIRTGLAGWRPEPFDKRRAEAYQAIRQQLERLCTVDFAETPLEDVVTFLTHFSKINLILDQALQAVRHAPVTVRLQDASTETVLGMMAYLTDTRMVFQNGVLMLTSEAALELVANQNLLRTAAGVVVQPDGYILTRLSTVEQAQQIWVSATDGTRHKATVVDTNPKTGTVLLKIAREGMAYMRKN